MKNFILPVLVLCFFSIVESVKLPNNLPTCSIGDDNCLNEAIEKALHYLCDHGLPEFKIPKLDPIEVPAITIGTKGSAVDILQKYINVKVTGFRNAKLSKSHVDLDKKSITFTTTTPEFDQLSDYDINGRILVFPLYGKGKSNLTQFNVSVKHDILFDSEIKHGKEYWKVKLYNVNITPQRVELYFENLFNGNQLLSDRVHKVVNENWQVVWLDSKKDFDNTYGQIYFGFTKYLFENIPVSDIFPKNNKIV